MEPPEFRKAMEKLGEEYHLPVHIMEDMITGLGLISRVELGDRGKEYQGVYLQLQHDTFKEQLSTVTGFADKVRSAGRVSQLEDDSSD